MCDFLFILSSYQFCISGQFLLEESRLIEAAEMAQKAAELDNTEFDVVFNAAHMLRLVTYLVFISRCINIVLIL